MDKLHYIMLLLTAIQHVQLGFLIVEQVIFFISFFFNKKISICQIINNNFIELEATDARGRTPLVAAVRAGSVPGVEFALLRGAQLDCLKSNPRTNSLSSSPPLLADSDRGLMRQPIRLQTSGDG